MVESIKGIAVEQDGTVVQFKANKLGGRKHGNFWWCCVGSVLRPSRIVTIYLVHSR